MEPTIGATLAFRPDEIRYYNSQESELENFHTLYAVCLIESPPWPEGEVSSACKPLVVACIQMTNWASREFPCWGWVHLDPDAKLIIGHDLEGMEAKYNQWIYMAIESPGKFREAGEEDD